MTEPTPTVYSYYSPTTQTIVQQALSELNFPHKIGGIHDLLKQNYNPGLDNLHVRALEKYEQFARSEGVIGLDTFSNKYFTNGSSEGIFHLFTDVARPAPLYQFRGEYQGYEAYADAIGRPIITVNSTEELLDREPGILIVSNPTSRDGTIIEGQMLREWTRKHRVIVDLAYMGATWAPLNLDLTNPGIIAVVGSLSKPFGMYYYRIGFCYSRYTIPSLYGNKWFKNALSIKLAEAVLDYYNPKALASFKNKMIVMQADAVEKANKHFGLDNYHEDNQIKPSPVWLLGYLARDEALQYDPSDLRPFKRVEGWNDRIPSIWRFCLTPYYMEMEH